MPTPAPEISAAQLAQWLRDGASEVAVIDVSPSATYAARHISGAWFAIRAQLPQSLARIPSAQRYVVTGEDPLLAAFAAQDLRALVGQRAQGADVFALAGGNEAWRAAGLTMESGGERYAVPPVDRYRRPYEGTAAPVQAMQAYLDWEFGLVAQLQRDGTHCFSVI